MVVALVVTMVVALLVIQARPGLAGPEAVGEAIMVAVEEAEENYSGS